LNCVKTSARNRLAYSRFWNPLGRLCRLADRQHQWRVPGSESVAQAAYRRIVRDLTVRSGPFAGLRYPSEASVGSTLLPKLLGSYEQELHGVVEQLDHAKYTAIVDIGCAEGYYAVGLAKRIESIPVFAYDTDPTSRQLCLDMASRNDVSQRVHVGERCDWNELRRLDLNRAIVWIDCEGYERELFSGSGIGCLAPNDFLIEIHDFIRPFTTEHLWRVFEPTHRIEVIRSFPDELRPIAFPNANLRELPTEAQIALMAEGRPRIMTWFWCKSNKQ
jgi:hypothetical protein